MIFEREIGMSDTLLDALWLEGYSISFAVGALKTILDRSGEERVRKYCPDITDEILAALKELGKDCTDDEYEADIMKMQIYEKAYAQAERALEAKKIRSWRESAVRESARFLKEMRDNDEEHYDDSVPVAIFTEYEEAPIVPSQFGTECPQKTEDRIRLARFFLELEDQSLLAIGNRMAVSILDASEAVMNTVLHRPQSACWRRLGVLVEQNLMWITCRHYILRFV